MTRALVLLALALFVSSLTVAVLERETSHELGSGVRDDVAVLASPPPDPCFDYHQLEAGTAERNRQRHFDHLDAKGYARWRIACEHGWGEAEWRCLETLWDHESGWYHFAENRRSGAYGIPQAVPGSKMRAAGVDWRENPRTQVRWGTSTYIADRYREPCAALAHFDRKGWY